MLGFVTAGLTIVVSLMLLAAVLSGDGDDMSMWVMLLGLPCAAGLIAGATELLRRRAPGMLLGSAVAAVVVLLVGFVVGVLELQADDLVGLAVFVVLALPLPLLTAIFARLRTVRDWVAAGPG